MNNLLDGLTKAKQKQIEASGILSDAGKMADLEGIIPEDRQNVLIQHFSMGVEWADAIAGAAPKIDHEPDNRDQHEANPNRFVQRVRVDSLKPNRWNAELFPDSLSEESVRKLAATMTEIQHVPIQITNSWTIVDGERRWRAATLNGWDEVDVIMVGVLDDEQILDRVLDAYASQRDVSLREKTRVYNAEKARLQRVKGRTQGRPGKTIPNEIVLGVQEVMRLAATRAGIKSVATAKKLEAVFDRADEQLQQQVNLGEISISEAYERLPKRTKRKTQQSEATEPADEGDQHSEPATDLEEGEPQEAEPVKTEDEEPLSEPQGDDVADTSEQSEGDDAVSEQDARLILADIADMVDNLAAFIETMCAIDLHDAEVEAKRIAHAIWAPVKRAKKRVAA